MYTIGKVAYTVKGVSTLLILFTACVYSSEMVDGVNTSKDCWFLFFIGLLAIAFACQPSSRIRLNFLDILVFFFWSEIILTKFTSGTPSTVEVIVAIGILSFYFFVKEFSSFSPKLECIGWLLLTGIQILLAVLQTIGIIESLHSYFKITGFFFNPAPFAIFLGASLIPCINYFYTSENRLIKGVSLLCIIGGIAIVVATFCRAALVGVTMGFLFFGVNRFKLKIPISLKIAGSITSAAVLFILYFLKKDSADGRLIIWRVAISTIEDNFLLGIGSKNIGVEFLKNQAAFFHDNPAFKITHGNLAGANMFAFNDMLEVFVKHGLIGFVVLTCIILIAFKYSIELRRAKSTFDSTPILIIVVILVAGIVSYPLSLLPILILFYFSLAKISKNYDIACFKTTRIKVVSSVLYRPVCFILGILFLFGSVSIFTAYRTWYAITQDNGLEYLSSSSDSTLMKLRTWDPILKNDAEYILLKVDTAVLNNNKMVAIKLIETVKTRELNISTYYRQAKLYQQLGLHQNAEAEYLFLTEALPSLLQPHFELAKLYFTTGQNEKWKIAAQRVLKFQPKVKSFQTDRMKKDIAQMLQ